MSQEFISQGSSLAHEVKYKKMKKVALCAAASVALVVAPVYVYENNQQQETQARQANRDTAYARARLYVAELNRSATDTSAKLPIWQGVIKRQAANGKSVVAVNPIILSTGKTTAETPTDNPEAPSYFGVIGSVGQKVTIVPYEFTADNSFIQLAPDGHIKRQVDSYVSPMYRDDVREGFQAFAFDALGNDAVVTPYSRGLISPGFQPR